LLDFSSFLLVLRPAPTLSPVIAWSFSRSRFFRSSVSFSCGYSTIDSGI
jgi:hypothetical protein